MTTPNGEHQPRASSQRVGCMPVFDADSSQEFSELLFSQPRVPNDSALCQGVDRVVSWDGDDPLAIGHYDVLRALASEAEPGLLKGTDDPLMGHARNLRHGLNRDVDFPNFVVTDLFRGNRQVLLDRIRPVGERFLLRCALRPAPGQTRNRDRETLLSLL